MTGLEIALFILGTAFIVISFFIVDIGKGTDKKGKSVLDTSELTNLRDGLVEDVTKEADIILHETEDKLERLSNDKIMAVGEYSDQVIEKIQNNHQEVVFLYQMLKEKEEELKGTAQKLENLRIECEKTVMEEESKPMTAIEALETGAAYQGLQEDQPKPQPAKKPATPKKPPVKKTKPKSAEPKVAATSLDTGALSRNDQIIALYKSKKSVLEISKLLGMGQGEVKLIIDLYCK